MEAPEEVTVPQYSRNDPHFMEPEDSLPHLQQAATCPCPKED